MRTSIVLLFPVFLFSSLTVFGRSATSEVVVADNTLVCKEGYKLDSAKKTCQKIYCTESKKTEVVAEATSARSAKNISAVAAAKPKSEPLDVTSEKYNTEKKCFKKVTTQPTPTCKEGYSLDATKKSCQKIYCDASKIAETAPAMIKSQSVALTDVVSEKYNATKKCFEKTTSQPAASCEEAYTSKTINGKKVCSMVLCAGQKISYNKLGALTASTISKGKILNSFDVNDNQVTKQLVSGKKCFALSLAKDACPKDFVVSSDSQSCEKAFQSCKRQPSVKHATAFSENFLYEAKSCYLPKLPTACEVGYALDDSGTDQAKCKAGSKESRRN